jgi:hypothetical protein
MARYRVSATMTISVYTDVEAGSKDEALEKARDHQNQSFCAQCSEGNPREEWVTSGELDGEPTALRADKL